MTTANVTVIGAGVVGLTTAIRLAEHAHTVRIVTADPPAATTSAAATAMVGLAFCEPMDRVPGWEAATLAELDTVRTHPGSGIRIQRCLLGSRTSDATPPGIESWPGYTPAEPDDVPVGFSHGFWIDMTVADMDRYLPYLVERFITAGGVIDIAHIESLDEITDSPIVVNCAGLGAGPLADDPTLTGQWGMHVVIDNPGINAAFMEGPPGPHDWVAWMPHGDRILIGGTIDTERTDPTPDAETGKRMLSAANAANPLLATAQVVGYNSGLRPSRPSVRVEEDDVGVGRRLIHNYGHGSLGVTLAWGCANDVTMIIDTNPNP